MHKPIRLHIPISKIDEEQRMVYGIATSEIVDSQGDIVDYEASKLAFSNWLGNIREMHQPIAVGKAIDIVFDDEAKQVQLGVKVSESADGENAWIKVKEGILQGFSIGGSVNKTVKQTAQKDGATVPVTRIIDYDLSETSFVDNPACPEAMFTMVKSVAGGGLQRVEKMATEAELKREASTPFWLHQFMPPIEKAQALYDNSMKKAGVAVVDGDPRNAAAATVSEVKANTPVKGGTAVPKKVYGSDGKSTTNKAEGSDMKKGLWDAAWLLDLALSLNSYISMEEYEGEDVNDLKAALETIKAAVVDELTEPTAELTVAVELAEKVTNLKKGKTMSDVNKGNVIGGVERNANAETIEDNRPPAGEPAAAEADQPQADSNAISEESDAGNKDAPKPATTPTAVAEPGDPNAETRSNEQQIKEEGQPENALAVDPKAGAEADKAPEKAEGEAKGKTSDEEAADEGSEKSVTVGDLKKFAEGIIDKVGDSSKQELTKALGEFTDKVEKSMTDLADRVKKLEDQPAAPKHAASYADVTKGDEGSEGAEAELKAVLKRRDELVANPTAGTPEERFEITKKLRKFQSQGHKLS